MALRTLTFKFKNIIAFSILLVNWHGFMFFYRETFPCLTKVQSEDTNRTNGAIKSHERLYLQPADIGYKVFEFPQNIYILH